MSTAPRSQASAQSSSWHRLAWRIVGSPLVLGLLTLAVSAQEMRFPKPEFQTGYDFPRTTVPPPTSTLQQWVDVGVLFAALSLATWLAVKKRSRKGLFALMVFSLAYFGFYKQGCVCPIGSIQNVALSLFDSNYAVPVTVLIFFLLPLIFALFFGRVFCSSVCALGAIQDAVLLFPVKVPKRLGLLLGMLPYAYLGAGILLAATGTGFIICRYDPFIGFFRLNGNAPYLYLGAGFLLIGVFVGRPYCRYLCPYGILLGWMSRFAKWHLSITPTSCVQCRLCEDSCPFDHIDIPNDGLTREERSIGVRRLGVLVLGLPLMVGVGAWVGHRAAIPLSTYNDTVRVAEQILQEQADPTLQQNKYTEAFRQQGMSEEELMSTAAAIRKRMDIGGWILGGFLGLVMAFKLLRMSIVRTQPDYEVNKPTCYSCARCCPTCPSDELHQVNFVTADLAAAPQVPAPPELVGAGQS